MGLLKGAVRATVLTKAVQIARREAAKPENQRRAKELFARVSRKRQHGQRPY